MMLDTLTNLQYTQMMHIYIFFIITTIFVVLIMYFIFKYTTKNIFASELDTYNKLSNQIFTNYKTNISKLDSHLDSIQNNSSNNFEVINNNLKSLDLILKDFKLNLDVTKELENEIIKLKKIIKRMEKNNELFH